MNSAAASVQDVLSRLEGVKGRQGSWSARCPAHEDESPSLSISEGDHGVLLHCHAGCDFNAIVAALGMEPGELFHDNGQKGGGGRGIVATYDYVDEDGGLLFQAVRYSPKDFRQRRLDGRDGWTWKLGNVRRVLYRLPEIIEAVALGKLVHIVEGEKDVHAIEAAGGIATTCPMGAGKWRPEYSETLRGARVRIVADRDAPGRDHARAVAGSLEGVAEAVEIVQAAEGKDAADHLAAGHGLDDLGPLPEGEEESDTHPLERLPSKGGGMMSPLRAAVARGVDEALTRPAPWPERPNLPGPPEPERLPVDVLPPVLRDMAATIHGATQAPMDAAVAAVLGGVSVALVGQAVVEIDPRRGWRKPVQEYVGIMMHSGMGKSPLITLVGEELTRWEGERAEELRPERRRNAERHRLAEERVNRARKAAASPGADNDAQSLYQNAVEELAKADALPRGEFQMMLQDATEEELVRIMAANDGRVACVDPEATLLEVAAGRYGNGDARLAALTHGWDREPMRQNRVSRARVDVPAANLALLVGIQPGVIEGLANAETMKQRGVLARFLWAAPRVEWDSVLVGDAVPALDLDAVARYRRMLRRLLSLSSPSVRVLTLTPEAQEGVYRMERMKVEGIRPGGRLASIPSWAGKLPDHGARIAALLALAHRADKGVADPFAAPIDVRTMDAAVELVAAFATHALKVAGEGGSPDLVNAGYVLDRAMALPEDHNGRRTLRALHRACDSRTGLKSRDDFQKVVDDLVDRGCLRVFVERTAGRPSDVFELNPNLYASGDKRDKSREAEGLEARDTGTKGTRASVHVPSGPFVPRLRDCDRAVSLVPQPHGGALRLHGVRGDAGGSA